MLNQREQFEVRRAYKDASAKVEALPARLDAEFKLAEEEKREPFPIEPLTEIPANLVVAAIEQIKGDVPSELSSIMAGQRLACSKLGKLKVLLLSEQLKAILDAAGIVPKDEPPQKPRPEGVVADARI